MPQPPDVLLVGNVTRDVLPGGSWRPGGSVVYAAHLAVRWGFRVAVLTSAADEPEARRALPSDADVRVLPSAATTTFRNVPAPDGRRQWVLEMGGRIELRDVPDAWRRSRAVLLMPVIGEVAGDMAPLLAGDALLGVGAQGFLRQRAPDGRVLLRDAHSVTFPHSASCTIFVSDEDLAATPEPERWLEEQTKQGTLVLYTLGDRGCVLYRRQGRTAIAAAPAREVDPTGAGDTAAAAFMMARLLGEQSEEAARLAVAAAACSIEGEGVAAVPGLAAARQRLQTEAA